VENVSKCVCVSMRCQSVLFLSPVVVASYSASERQSFVAARYFLR